MPQFTLGNLEAASSKIKGRRSAPGPEGVTYAMMEDMPQPIATCLVATMQRRLHNEEPEEDPWDYASVTFIANKTASHRCSPLAPHHSSEPSETCSSTHSWPGPNAAWRTAFPPKCQAFDQADRLPIYCSSYIG